MEQMQNYIEIVVLISSFILIEMIKPLINENQHKKVIPLLASLIGVLLIWWAKKEMNIDVFTTGLVSGGSATWLKELIKGFTEPKTIEVPIETYKGE